MKKQIPLAQHIRELGDRWLDAAPRCTATQRAYRVEIQRFLSWLAATSGGPPDEVSSNLLGRYLDDISSSTPEIYALAGLQRTLKSSSVLQSKRILGALLMWAAEANELPLALATQARRWKKSSAGVSAAERGPKRIEHPVRAPVSEEGQARREFVAALAYWLGASPQQISKLERRSIRMHGSVLRVRLPDGAGQEAVSYGPPAMVKMWCRLKQLSCTSTYAIVRIGSSSPVSASTIVRVLRLASSLADGSNFRTLRRAGVNALRAQGWPEAVVLKQYRRKALPQPQSPLTPQCVAQLMSKINLPTLGASRT